MSKEFEEGEIFCMGTNIIQKLYGENINGVIGTVEKEMRRLEGLMNFYKASSEIGRLNDFGFQREQSLSAEVFELIESAKKFSELTRGAFDITIGKLTKLWGIFTENAGVPSCQSIKTALETVGYKKLAFNKVKSTVKFLESNMAVDLGGIAKGYAADRALELYKAFGVEAGFINLGGNVLVFGQKPDAESWSIGIQNPFENRGEIIGAVTVKDKSVVTSGSYVRYFESDNVRYHHILDPRTGYPADSELMSVTVISKGSMEGDALSTAAFVLGLEKGLEFIEGLQGIDAIFITKNRQVVMTQNIRQDLYITEESGFNCI